MALKQANRLLVLKTPLGEDVLLLTAFRGREELSGLYHYQLEMISDNNAISAAQIVGKNVSFAVKLGSDKPRWFNGFVSRFSAGDEDGQGRRNYSAEVVPWLWFLTRTADCRIFQNKTIPQIIEQIFKDLDFKGYDVSRLSGDLHKPWDYCVQYRETDFNFVSRLMEQEGIFYYFRHEDGKHTLILADQAGGYFDCPENDAHFIEATSSQMRSDGVVGWRHEYEFTVGKWSQTDYNFIEHPARSEATPASLLMISQPTRVKLDNILRYEVYDAPGEYPDKDVGKNYTKFRMEEDEVPHDVVQGAGTYRTFTPGGKFKLSKHPSHTEEGKSYVLTAVEHLAEEPLAYETGESVEQEYSNTFTCIPDSVVFRPPRVTPKPVVAGAQTAVVVGPSGEEIYPDKYGRVKVQFFWDREGKRDENSSCWIRCAQSIAADRSGGRGELPGRRSRPPADYRHGLQRRPDASLFAARQQDAKRH
jgi:type VI secretion system secreted protein VgrG